MNPSSLDLQAIFKRIEAGEQLNSQEQTILVEAVRSKQATIATGDRAVALGGSADNAVIITGDHNIIVPKEVSQLLNGQLGGISNIDQQFGDRQNVVFNFFMQGNTQGKELDQVRPLLEQLPLGIIQQAYQKAAPVDADLFRAPTTDYDQIVTALQDFRKLPTFVQWLANHPEVEKSIREKLAQTLQQNQSASSQGKNSSTLLQSYLLLTLRPAKKTDEFLVNGWLIPDDTVQDQASRFQPLDIDLVQKGSTCKLTQLPELLDKLIKLSLDHLMGKRYELTIEIFLPLDHLYTNVDQWALTDAFFEDESYAIGAKYRVIVRSQERLDRKYLASRLNQWYTNWERVKSCWDKVPNDGEFEHLSDLENCNWKLVVSSLMQKLGLKLTCGLNENRNKELFTSILKASAPIALWTRRNCSNLDQVTEMNQLLLTGPLVELSETIRKKRESASLTNKPEDDLGGHLALLWEDPYRLPPDVLAQLIPPGQ